MDTHVTLWSESAAFPLLTTLTLVPLAAMVAILCSRSSTVALRFGFSGTLLTVLLSLYLLAIFDSGNPGIHLVEQVHFAWFSYSVGVDGANILFIPLTAVLTLLALVYTLITRHVTDRLFIACLLGYEGILIGAFAALNVMQFWLWSCTGTHPGGFVDNSCRNRTKQTLGRRAITAILGQRLANDPGRFYVPRLWPDRFRACANV